MKRVEDAICESPWCWICRFGFEISGSCHQDIFELEERELKVFIKQRKIEVGKALKCYFEGI